jgi:hypothetical protein
MKKSFERRRIGCLAKLANMIGGLVIALTIIEIGFRLFAPQMTYSRAAKLSADFYRTSDRLPYELKPNYRGDSYIDEAGGFFYQVEINSHGFRGAEFSIEKPENTYRIMIVGDSFTFGYGVDEGQQYPALLESCLNRESDGSVTYQVINAGFASSFSPDSFYVFLRYIAPAYQPDMIIEAYFIQNDFTDLMDTYWTEEENGLPQRVLSELRFVDPSGIWRFRDTLPRYQVPVLRESHAFQFVMENLNLIASVSSLPDYMRDPDLYTSIYKPTLPSRLQAPFDESMRMVSAAHDLASDQGWDFNVLLIPGGLQIDPDAWEDVVDTPYPQTPDNAYPQHSIQAYLDDQGIDSLDLLPTFWDLPRADYYFEPQGHWTAQGQQLAADTLCEALLTNR